MNAGAALIASATAVAAAASARIIVHGFVATDQATSVDVVTGAGVFSAAMALGYYLLRRSDNREREQNIQAQADLKALRDENALMRADHAVVRDQLIAALTENALLSRQIAELRKGQS